MGLCPDDLHVDIHDFYQYDQYVYHVHVYDKYVHDEYFNQHVYYVYKYINDDVLTMKVIINTASMDISVGFDGFDYMIPAGKPVLAEGKVAEFLKERYPFLQIEEPPRVKGPSPVPVIEKKKTRRLIKTEEERIASAPTSDLRRIPNFTTDITEGMDGLPVSGTDKDGVEWVGAGVETDNLTTKKAFR